MKLGEFIDDDIYHRLPGRLASRDGIGGTGQIPLFTLDPEIPLRIDEAIQISELIYGHFGNPREGLVKRYLGAIAAHATGGQRWAWVLRQDHDREEQGISRPRSITPFDRREIPSLVVKPKRGASANRERLQGHG